MQSGHTADKLIILDRDGVINRDSDAFVRTPDEWIPLDGSIDAIARLSRAGFTVAVATNQSGLARGLFDREALDAMHAKLERLVRKAGGRIGRIEVCPHGPDDGCECRKPAPGLLRRIADYYGSSLDGVPVVGDSLRDLEAAHAVGGRPILVRTGNGTRTEQALAGPLTGVERFDNLASVADFLLADR